MKTGFSKCATDLHLLGNSILLIVCNRGWQLAVLIVHALRREVGGSRSVKDSSFIINIRGKNILFLVDVLESEPLIRNVSSPFKITLTLLHNKRSTYKDNGSDRAKNSGSSEIPNEMGINDNG